MNPVTGAPDASDLLRQMRMWLLGSPPGWKPYVMGELELEQAVVDRARRDAIAALVAATYPVPPIAQEAQPSPFLPFWIVCAKLEPGPTSRPGGVDASLYNRVELSISNSPLALSFTVDPRMPEEPFRNFIRQQYALIWVSAVVPTS